jgi:hypothetical protein
VAVRALLLMVMVLLLMPPPLHVQVWAQERAILQYQALEVNKRIRDAALLLYLYGGKRLNLTVSSHHTLREALSFAA